MKIEPNELTNFHLTGERYFCYAPLDLRVFYLTRRLAALQIDLDDYRRTFQTELQGDFSGELRALLAEGLMEQNGLLGHALAEHALAAGHVDRPRVLLLPGQGDLDQHLPGDHQQCHDA